MTSFSRWPVNRFGAWYLAVTARYQAPNRFAGHLEKVVVDVAEAPEVDPATTFRNAMAAD